MEPKTIFKITITLEEIAYSVGNSTQNIVCNILHLPKFWTICDYDAEYLRLKQFKF